MPVGVSFLPALNDVFKALEIHVCRTMSLINHHGVFVGAFTTAVFTVRTSSTPPNSEKGLAASTWPRPAEAPPGR